MAYQNSTEVAARLVAFQNRMRIINPAETSEIGSDQIELLQEILHDLDPTVRLDEQQITQWLLNTLVSAQALITEQASASTPCPPCPPCPPAGQDSFEWEPSSAVSPFGSFSINAAGNGPDAAEYFPGMTSFICHAPALGEGMILFRGDTLESISFPDLETINVTSGFVFVQALNALTTARFPKLTRWKKQNAAGSITCGVLNCPLLTTLELAPDFTVDEPDTGNNEIYDFRFNALPQATVDFILVRAAATMTATIPGGTQLQILLDGGTNATPSAAGLAAKVTLVARNVTVTNN